MYKVYTGFVFGITIALITQHDITTAQAYNGNHAGSDYYNGESLPYKESIEAADNYAEAQTKEQGYSVLNDRFGQRSDEEDNLQNLDYYSPPNYDFEYQVHGGGNSLGHTEKRLNTQTSGMYFVDLPNGMRQIVTYTADENGFHPKITYEPISSNNILADSARYNIENFNAETEHQEYNPALVSDGPTRATRVVKIRRRRQRKSSIHDHRYSRFPEFGLRV